MKYVVLLTCLFLSAFSIQGYGGTLGGTEAAKGFAESSMKLIAKGEYEKGVNFLVPYWPLPESEIKQMIYGIQSQMAQIGSRFGDPIDYEFIKVENVGNSFVRFVYIQKFKNHALRWMFLFYKPKDTWQVNSVLYDDQIFKLF